MSNKVITPDVIKQLNEAWLHVDRPDSEIINPFDILRTDDPDEFHKKLTFLMMNSEFLHFTCKHILNIELLPFQALILQEMWNRKFPMLIASRGAGKATTLDMPVLLDTGWVKMGDVKIGDRIYARDGKLHNITGVYPQGQKQKCQIVLMDGRSIECCEDHLWTVLYQNKEKVVTTKEIINSGVAFSASKSGGRVYKYKIPQCEPIDYPKQELIIDPYIVGCLLGDGCTTTLTPKIASDDVFIIQQFKNKLPDFQIEQDPTNNNYTIVDKNKEYTEKIHPRTGTKFLQRSKNRLTAKLKELKINVKCKEKFIPDCYKYSSIEDRYELIRGLMDTDGSITKTGAIEFTNTSEKLIDDVIEVLRSLGIVCSKSINDRSDQSYILPRSTVSKKRSKYFRVFINTSKEIFKLPRKRERLKSKCTNAEKYVSIVKAEYINQYAEMQCISVDSPDSTYITKDYIVTHNTFLLSLYSLLRALFMPGRKIVIAGAAFRQSKFLHEYMENIWKNAPILRDICDGNSGPRRDVDVCRMRINDSVINAIPIGDGSKIRGLRANDIIADEFASMSREIFENVIAGFAAVSASPAENHRISAALDKARKLGYDPSVVASCLHNTNGAVEAKGNQIILSGTAYYDFNHFADYWKKWKAIIETGGDQRKLSTEVFGGNDVPENFKWDDYSVIRIPFELIPKGFMDEAQVARSKATIHNGIYLMEFGAVFAKDSQGFFKRSLIESCVGTETKPVELPSGSVYFDPMLIGNPNCKYVMGVDPASEIDNFSIVILECHSDHRRIVHCWTTTRKDHAEMVRKGLTSENNFYSYCARKIRQLMSRFNIAHIALDAQGGGIAISEALHDKNQLQEGELPIWPTIDENKEKPTDGESGLHILELCQFAKYDWYCEANHGLRKDFEDRVVVFPRFDPITLGLSIEEDKAKNRLYDTLEDCVMDIEELKNELSLIEITQSVNGRDRWDTPEVKIGVGKKERMRKDRYSALLMANMAARVIANTPSAPVYEVYGGFATTSNKKKQGYEPDFTGPAWFVEQMRNVY